MDSMIISNFEIESSVNILISNFISKLSGLDIMKDCLLLFNFWKRWIVASSGIRDMYFIRVGTHQPNVLPS